MTPIDWSSESWGNPATCVHIADEPGDKHTSEPDQEASR